MQSLNRLKAALIALPLVALWLIVLVIEFVARAVDLGARRAYALLKGKSPARFWALLLGLLCWPLWPVALLIPLANLYAGLMARALRPLCRDCVVADPPAQVNVPNLQLMQRIAEKREVSRRLSGWDPVADGCRYHPDADLWEKDGDYFDEARNWVPKSEVAERIRRRLRRAS